MVLRVSKSKFPVGLLGLHTKNISDEPIPQILRLKPSLSLSLKIFILLFAVLAARSYSEKAGAWIKVVFGLKQDAIR